MTSRRLVVAAICLTTIIVQPGVRADIVDPLADGPAETGVSVAGPTPKPAAQNERKLSQKPRQSVRAANYQPGAKPPSPEEIAQPLPVPPGVAEAAKDPCYAGPNKPLNQLGISIVAPEGKLPADLASPCWVQINQTTSPVRCWTVSTFNWEATCFYHNPLYFEEINLERYGYQCGDRCCCFSCGYECCLQPAASAAHFFGTIPALPYCIAADCPTECVYTLGHYRPGNCNPRRCHWPSCDPIAAATAGGVWTGLIFAIP